MIHHFHFDLNNTVVVVQIELPPEIAEPYITEELDLRFGQINIS